MPEILSVQTFGNVQHLRARMAVRIQPTTRFESGCLHHKCISVPTTYGITHPGGIRIHGKRPAVHENLPIALNGFKKHDHHAWCIDDFERIRRHIGPRYSSGNAKPMWIIFTFSFAPLLVDGLSPRKHDEFTGLEIFRDVVEVPRRWRRQPESRYIGLAVRGFRSRSVQIRLAVRSSRYSGSSMVR